MSKRVTLTRQINGSDGTFAAGTELDLPDATAESLVSQGAATPLGWQYKGKLGTLPAPARETKVETAARKPATETAASRTGKALE